MSQLTKKQLKIIDEWVKSGGDEIEISTKYGISYRQWVKWLNNKSFSREIAGRIELARRRSQLLMAKYIPLAAAKLVELCGSDKEETRRKACLDVLAYKDEPVCSPNCSPDSLSGRTHRSAPDADKEKTPLDTKTATKILAALAGEEK